MIITCKDVEVTNKPNSTYKNVNLITPVIDTVGELVGGFGNPSDVEKMLLEYIAEWVPVEVILSTLDEEWVVEWVQRERSLLDPQFDIQEMVDAISEHKHFNQYTDDLLRDIPDECIREYARDRLDMEDSSS